MNRTYVSQIQRCETQLPDFLTLVLSGAFGDFSHRLTPDKWSALENLAHLAHYHEIFLKRVDRILKENRPVFSRYRAEEDPEWELWRQQPYPDLLDRLATLRAQLGSKLKSLSDEDFQRVGVHAKFGELKLSQWLEFFLAHEGHHLYLIFQQVRVLMQSSKSA